MSSSHGVHFKEPKPKKTALPLVKPKDEPVTDDTSQLEVPLLVTRQVICFFLSSCLLWVMVKLVLVLLEAIRVYHNCTGFCHMVG